MTDPELTLDRPGPCGAHQKGSRTSPRKKSGMKMISSTTSQETSPQGAAQRAFQREDMGLLFLRIESFALPRVESGDVGEAAKLPSVPRFLGGAVGGAKLATGIIRVVNVLPRLMTGTRTKSQKSPLRIFPPPQNPIFPQ